MSTNTAELNRARERVLALARQIEDLAHPEIDEQTFFPEFLKRLLSAVGAPAGVIWLRGANNRVELRCEQGLAQTGYKENPQADQQNSPLLSDVFSTGQSSMYGAGERTDKPTPTNHLHILSPIVKGRECIGAVQVFQRPDTNPAARPGYLQFIEQMCGYASRYVQLREEGQKEAPESDFWREFNRFSIDMSRTLDVKEVASTAANDGRQLIRCDRVSVAVFRGKKLRMTAITGQQTVNRKANVVRLLEKLASKVVATSEPLVYNGKIDNLPPQIETPLADYIQESGARGVIILPLFASQKLVTVDPDKKTGKKPEVKRRVIGAFIVEQITESRPRPGMIDRINLVAEHVATSLTNALTHQNLFLLPVWRALGQVQEALRGRTLLKVLGITALVTGIIAALLLMTWDYRVEGKGRLMPTVKHQVFAMEDGQVMQVFVKGGERVNEGDLLVKLRNDELQARYVQAQNEFREYAEMDQNLVVELNRLSNSSDISQRERDLEKVRLSGRRAEAKIKRLAAEMQAELLEKQLALLEIRAPSTGVVATFHVDQLLENRPVQRGEVLLEVMDTTQDWRLELDVPDYRLGHILREQIKKNDPHLPVEYVLATASETKFQGSLEQIATRAVPSEADGSVVEMFVHVNPDDLKKVDLLRIGAEVRAKINCGPKMLGYVLFGDVVEFIQNRLWF